MDRCAPPTTYRRIPTQTFLKHPKYPKYPKYLKYLMYLKCRAGTNPGPRPSTAGAAGVVGAVASPDCRSR
ncbi:hypothetical protein GCM10022232_12930 [Streptomyces plumbiresistens]|uniref:Uncharacterized protein n=1 Tax=Streptomyces plumbiresistens TaxID=511811 RepID=A0ABP7QJ78_9ACTN